MYLYFFLLLLICFCFLALDRNNPYRHVFVFYGSVTYYSLDKHTNFMFLGVPPLKEPELPGLVTVPIQKLTREGKWKFNSNCNQIAGWTNLPKTYTKELYIYLFFSFQTITTYLSVLNMSIILFLESFILQQKMLKIA